MHVLVCPVANGLLFAYVRQERWAGVFWRSCSFVSHLEGDQSASMAALNITVYYPFVAYVRQGLWSVCPVANGLLFANVRQER